VLRLSKDTWYYSKVIVGHALGENANTELAMETWGKAEFMLRDSARKLKVLSFIMIRMECTLGIGGCRRWL